MFESAELGHRLDKKTYRREIPLLREALLKAQQQLRKTKKLSVVIVISGVDGSGKGETINQLYEWMDARYLSTLAFHLPSDEERERPFMWRYWRALPPKGRIAIFSGSWYSQPITDRLNKKITAVEYTQRNEAINRFETMLLNEETIVLKFWFHMSKKAHKSRLKALSKDPKQAWRVTKEGWGNLKTHDRFQKAAKDLLSATNTPWAPWIIVEATDDLFRNLTVGKKILEAIEKQQTKKEATPPTLPAPLSSHIDQRDILSELTLQKSMSKAHYIKALAKLQQRLWQITRHLQRSECSALLVFEGSDAAGKGGSIRRLIAAMDARYYQVIPIAAPTDEESSHPYLWRFWRHLPRNGRITIFDRSWYGRVLVERIEKICPESDWLRAYREINDFEKDVVLSKTLVIKFWLQISQEEQLRRFKEREKVGFKRFKITDEDWRNRKQWPQYHQAVCDMVDRTSTAYAPWVLVEADNKYFARIKILKTLCERLEQALN